MMSSTKLAKTPFTPWDWFNYVFTYFPVTNWQHAFSPVINFGTNIEDAPEEDHVVNEVGSYGFQLNRIIDVLQVIVTHNQFKGFNAEQKKIVDKFLKLAEDTDRASREFKGEATEDSVHRLIDGMRSLQNSNGQLYDKLLAEIQAEFTTTRKRHAPKARVRKLTRAQNPELQIPGAAA